MEGDNAFERDLVERLLQETASRIAGRRAFPEATYRLQFHAGFTFRDASAIADYLRLLGISHCYASPYLKAQPGSTHGYNIVDHNAINPEIGGVEDYEVWCRTLDELNLGQILDIVPNHMGVATNDNAWWNDVLENGPLSRYAGYFDIAWRASSRPELHDKVLLPALGELYGDVLQNGGLRLEFEGGAFFIVYEDRRFPVSPRTYVKVLDHASMKVGTALGNSDAAYLEFQSILTAISNLPGGEDAGPEQVAELSREKEIIKRRLAELSGSCVTVRDSIGETVGIYNGKAGDPSSYDLLDDLLEHQCYRLAYWRVAPDEINYRRFFDINELAALSMEREEVFADAHRLVLRLVAREYVDGLRIDHPDGLYDPAGYFSRLQHAFVAACAREVAEGDPEFGGIPWENLEGRILEQLDECRDDGRCLLTRKPLYVIAEKILGAEEPLIDSWAIHGTSGYEFINVVNGLFIDRTNEAAFTSLYQDWIGDDTRFEEIVYGKKRLILEISLASELHMLTNQLDRLAQADRRARDFTFNTLHDALREVIACFPVYRSYIADEGPHEADRQHVDAAILRALTRNPAMNRRVFEFIREVLLDESPGGSLDEVRAERLRFAGKFQQVTAPVTAKGIEDTAFYINNRLASLNEVGGDPDRFGVEPRALHDFNRNRQRRWPYSLSPLSTHDTKRSEDVRARLNVLSEIPGVWRSCLERWGRLNAPHRGQINGQPVPDRNEEYLLYQTLIGAWPIGMRDPGESERFVERIQEYMKKALYEAKVHTSWTDPHEEYDAALRRFIDRILDPGLGGAFLEDFRAFQGRIGSLGLLNSLAQTLLKLTCPGVPDTYQGTELWDFSLVDPDNRRPVDYGLRRKMLDELDRDISAGRGDMRALARRLVEDKEDGRIKLYITSLALRCRRDRPGLFSTGEYLPLAVEGEYADTLFAFARRDESRWAIIAVPRFMSRLIPDTGPQRSCDESWGGINLRLDGIPPGIRWKNLFTGTLSTTQERSRDRPVIPATELFEDFPVAMLLSVLENE
ncbi:MAG: malto-oligosyltrehalose synthase [Isosphaeraceae bacterium]